MTDLGTLPGGTRSIGYASTGVGDEKRGEERTRGESKEERIFR